MPALIARLIIREAGCASRLATMRSPRRKEVPNAIASRVAVSGVMSTLTMPETPSAEKSDDNRVAADQRPLDVGAGLDVLVRIDPHIRRDHALSSNRALVPDHHAFRDDRVCSDLAVLADRRASHLRARAEIRVRIDDAELRLAEVLDDHVVAEDRIAADLHGRVEGTVVPDHGRPGDVLEVLRERPLADVHVLAQAGARDLRRTLPSRASRLASWYCVKFPMSFQ